VPQADSEGQDREGEDYAFIADSGEKALLKRCHLCNKDLQISEFYGDTTKSGGIRSKCKSCANKYNRKYDRKRYKTPERKKYMREYLRQYRAKQAKSNTPQNAKKHTHINKCR